MKKVDIMNQRKGETWVVVNGKTQRVEEKKVTGAVIQNAIKEVKVVEPVASKKIKKEKDQWKKSKKRLK